MKTKSKNNDSNSANPVATAPPPPAKSKSESVYLKEQAANAKAAFTQTLSEIATGLGRGASVKAWTAEHPWVMVSSAAIAGFTVACATVPSKQESALRKLAQLEAALNPSKSETSDNHKETNGKEATQGHFLASMTAAILKGVAPALASALTAVFSSHSPEVPTPPDTADASDPMSTS
jgi:hypothetical protein